MDQERLSASEQDELRKAQADYWSSRDKGDEAGMAAAAAKGVAIRSKHNYATDSSGLNPYDTGSKNTSGSSSRNSSSGQKSNGLPSAGSNYNGTAVSGRVVRANPDGTSNSQIGDLVVTAGGTYIKTANGGVLVDQNTTTSNYNGGYKGSTYDEYRQKAIDSLNEFDRNLPDAKKEQIIQDKINWQISNENGDQAGMKAASDDAAQVRRSENYAADSSGSNPYALDSTGMSRIDGSSSGLLALGASYNGTQYSGHILRSNPDGSSNAKVGDLVITSGGTYMKTANGSVLVNKDVTSDNYQGSYSAVGSFDALRDLSYYRGGTQTTGNVYKVQPGGSAPEGLGVGDLVVTGGGTYIIESVKPDGTYTASPYSAITTAEATDDLYGTPQEVKPPTTEELAKMVADGNVTGTFRDRDGRNAPFYKVTISGRDYYVNADGTQAQPGGITYQNLNGRETQGVLLQLDEGGYLWKEISVSDKGVIYERDDNGNYRPKETASDYVMYNNRTYNINTGTSIGTDPDFDPSNDVVYWNGRFWDEHGNDVSDVVNQQQKALTTDNSAVNELMYSMLDQYNESPRLRDYDHLTWEQALARAADQLNGSYDKRLQDNLDKLNKQALNTGFFGQLPAEQLKQQAVAENEVARQQAINELANTLYDNSYSEATTEYNADATRNEQQVNTLNTIFNAYQTYTKSMRDYETNMATLSQQESNAAYDRVYDSYNSIMTNISDVLRSLDPELQGSLIQTMTGLFNTMKDNFMNFTQNAAQYSSNARDYFNQYNSNTYNYRGAQSNAQNNYTRQ